MGASYGAYPARRLRRLRQQGWLREMVRETRLHPSDVILPVFVTEGEEETPILHFPGVVRYPLSSLATLTARVAEAGIRAVMLFPYIEPGLKDSQGSEATRQGNLVSRAVAVAKRHSPNVGVICDVALDPYTDHGHDGVIENGVVHNDKTVHRLAQQALFLAEAGADMLAPSDMMDGRVGYIRAALDSEGVTDIPILSYAVKYASSCYGPFRHAVGSAGALGGADKHTYQLDTGNSRQALLEAALDAQEGADVLMVKPALPCLDIVHMLRREYALPIFAYQVSTEYAMICAAAECGITDYNRTLFEYVLACKRAGADCIVTYGALDIAEMCGGE
jgi:porphobilinogen synthase